MSLTIKHSKTVLINRLLLYSVTVELHTV